MAWYYGYMREAGKVVHEIFYSTKKPTESSHGSRYSSATGPFATKAEAVAATPAPWRVHSSRGRQKNRMTRLLEEHDRRPKLRQRSRFRRNAASSTTRQSLAKIRGELYDAKKYAEEAKRKVTSPRSRRHLDDIHADLDRVKKVVDRQTAIIMEIEEGRSGRGL